MANISIWGANYTDCPAVNLPTTGGGTTRFTDTSPTTAVASDVANGKIFFKSDGTQDTGTASGGGVNLQTKSKTYTPSTSQQTEAVTADSGYDGLDTVNITVNAMSAMTLPNSPSSTSSGTSKATISRSTSTRYLNIPTGYNSTAQYYTISAVADGTAGTPTATKGTVSNHSVSVTPSVTNTTGYITGSTKTGTAVTVSASELVSGSETKTENGTYDVTNLASLIVNVAGGGGSGKTFETGTYTPTSDTARPQIKFSGTHTVPPALVFMSDTSSSSGISSNSNTSFMLCDMYRCFGAGYPYSTSATRYAIACYSYRSSNSSTVGSVQIQYNSDNTSTSSSSYYRYWASTTDFHPYSNSSSRYWRANRTYKWIAIWY